MTHNADILKNVLDITQGLYILPGKGNGAGKVHQSEMFAILQQITRDTLTIAPLSGQVSIQTQNADTTNRPNGTNYFYLLYEVNYFFLPFGDIAFIRLCFST